MNKKNTEKHNCELCKNLPEGEVVKGHDHRIKTPCRYGICDGDGIDIVGEHDDIRERPCLHVIEDKQLTDESLQDN